MNIIEGKVTTGLVKLSYAHIFEPYAVEGNEPKYSISIIISKNDTKTLKAINAVTDQVKKDKDKDNEVTNCDATILRLPLRDGDIERSGDPLYKGCYFLNANSKNKPGIVDSNVNPIVEPIEVKNGYYARVSFNLYDYDLKGNRGIAAGLNNIQLIGGAM